MSRQKKGTDDWDKTKTRYYVDEFFSDRQYDRNGPTPFHKRKHEFGPLALYMIEDQVGKLLEQYRPTLPEGAPDTPRDCANQFYADCQKNLLEAMDSPETENDAKFVSFIKISAEGWFRKMYARTDEGKAKEALRKRMGRDSRFTNEFTALGKDDSAKNGKPTGKERLKGKRGNWGLSFEYLDSHGLNANEYHAPSTVSEAKLETVALQYPVSIDRKALQDADRKRNPNYGLPGQMENMLEGVFNEAKGTLPLGSVFQIVRYRMAVLEHFTATHPTDEDGNPIDFAVDYTSAADAALEAIEGEDDKQWMTDLAEALENLTPKRKAKYLNKHPEILNKLLNSKNPNIHRALLALEGQQHEQKA
ncbi:hypothetical protein [Bifidobacterium parmae]|uniref:Uncharacterized protein n=1 Tax=Bifidobacterium parmae TaxID=361854 RepID=A0A2N5J4P1_9BIFI|nr:hypothetical protein [Bifidobacterium parmae]PLS29163.1 hypothetical protein Uis4E_0741 [Bifidobacterium parmae]